MLVVCSSCQAKIKAPDSKAGKTVACPKCKAPVVLKLLKEEKNESHIDVDAVPKQVDEPQDDRSIVQKISKVFRSTPWEIVTGKAFKPDPPAPVEPATEEPRGNIVCPYCDDLVAENVLLKGQPIACPKCHASFAAPGWGDHPEHQAMIRDAEEKTSKANAAVAQVIFWIIYVIVVSFVPVDLIFPFTIGALVFAVLIGAAIGKM